MCHSVPSCGRRLFMLSRIRSVILSSALATVMPPTLRYPELFINSHVERSSFPRRVRESAQHISNCLWASGVTGILADAAEEAGVLRDQVELW